MGVRFLRRVQLKDPVRSCSPQVYDYTTRLEANLRLSQHESAELVRRIEGFLSAGGQDGL